MALNQNQIKNLRFDTVSEAESQGRPNEICFVRETNTWYKFDELPVGMSRDGLSILDTGVIDRYWLAVAGLYATRDALIELSENKKDFCGFENRTDSTLSINDTGLFTIAPTSTSYTIWVGKKKYIKTTSASVNVTENYDLTYIYFDDDGVIQASTTSWTIVGEEALIAIVYRSDTIYRIWDERHRYDRNRAQHYLDHMTIGARFGSGLTGSFPSANAIDGTFSIASGRIWDEELFFDITGPITTATIWYRRAAGGMNIIPNSSTAYTLTGGQLAYDNEGTLAAVNNNNYTNYWIYASTDSGGYSVTAAQPIYILMGQNQHNTADLADNAALPQIPLTTREWKLLYRVVYQRTSGGIRFIKAVDLRTNPIIAGNEISVTNHNALVGRDEVNSHPATAISYDPTVSGLTATDVKSAIDELDGIADGLPLDDYVFVDGEMIPVVYMTGDEATAAGWTFSESGGELTITDVPTLSSPTHIRIPDFVDGLPVRHIGDSGPWELFRKAGTVTNITGITSLTLTTVADNTFSGCTSLVSANLPSLTTAGHNTFYNCPSLESVNLPLLTTAGHNTFEFCESLVSVNFPSLTILGNQTFGDCLGLVSVDLPSLTTLGVSTFLVCSSLVSANLPSLTAAGDETFRECENLKSVFLGAHFTPSGTTDFYTDTSQDLVIYYPPGDTGYGAFWPDGTATENSNIARPVVPDSQRWNGVINDGEAMVRNGNDYESGEVGGSGDVVGPATSTDNAIVRFDGTTGKLIQNSNTSLDDTGNISVTGLQFGSGQAVDTIETTLTNDDTHIPTSGAVFDAIDNLGEDIVVISTTTVLTDTAFGNIHSLQGTGSYSVTLPEATVANEGQIITLYKEDNSSLDELITVNTNGVQVINANSRDDYTSLEFRFTGELISLVSHDGHWDVRGSSSLFTTAISVANETEFINGIRKMNWLGGGIVTLVDEITLAASRTVDLTGIRIFGDSGEGTRINFPNESFVLTVTGAGFYFDSVRFKGMRTDRNSGTSQHILTLVSDGVNSGKFENCVFRDICTSNINDTNGNISLTRDGGSGYNISFTDCDIFTGGSGGADGLHFVNLANNLAMSFMNIFAVLHKRVTDNFNLFRLTGGTFANDNANSYSDGSVVFDTEATGNVLINPAILTGAPLVNLQTAKTTPASDDLLLLSSTTDSGALRKTTVSELAAVIGADAYVTAPATSTSTGVQGQRAYSDNYVYECVATDTWVRYAAESTWS